MIEIATSWVEKLSSLLRNAEIFIHQYIRTMVKGRQDDVKALSENWQRHHE